MAPRYARRALEVLREEGPVEFSKRSTRVIFRELLNPVDPEYYRRFRVHTRKNHLQNRIKYDAPPDPYASITIEPAEIDFRLRRKDDSLVIPQAKRRGIGRTRGGDWDTHDKRIEDTSDGRGCIIKGLRQRFELGMEWEETVHYEYNRENFDEGHCEYGCVSEYLNDRMAANERLYEQISRDGYRRGHVGKPVRPGVSEPVESRLEVLVVIDREGSIYLFGGYHRFSIARILGIEIPVQVVCRHKQWQEFRDKVHNNGLAEEDEGLRDHPDLQDVLD